MLRSTGHDFGRGSTHVEVKPEQGVLVVDESILTVDKGIRDQGPYSPWLSSASSTELSCLKFVNLILFILDCCKSRPEHTDAGGF